MKAELDFSSIDNFQKKLEVMGKKGEKIEGEALLAGARIILDEQYELAPKRTGKASGLLEITYPKKIKGILTVKIGIQKSDNSQAFYLKFHEWGTSKMPARPFMRPAFERKKKEALEKTFKVIRRGLDL